MNFIEKNDIKIGNRNITYQELLKILFIINGNDIVIDFENLEEKDHQKRLKEILGEYDPDEKYDPSRF